MVPVATPNVPSPTASPSAATATVAAAAIAGSSSTAMAAALPKDSGAAPAVVNGILTVRVVEAKNLTGSAVEGTFYIVIEFDKVRSFVTKIFPMTDLG